jgi:hypothetical protein
MIHMQPTHHLLTQRYFLHTSFINAGAFTTRRNKLKIQDKGQNST